MNYVQHWLFLTNQSEPLRQTSLLMLLAGSLGHGDSLLQGLRAHESESEGAWADKVSQLRRLLEQGQPLSAALGMVRDLLPEQTVTSIRIAEQSGALPAVLLDEARRLSSGMQRTSLRAASLENILLWAFVVGTVIVSLVSFIMVWIIPKFKEIFLGFGVELPGITMLVIEASDVAMTYGALLMIPGCLMGLWLVWLGFRSARQRLVRGYFLYAEYWPRYWVPGILRMVSVAVATRTPISTALDAVMAEMPPGRAAIAFGTVRREVAQGQEFLAAMSSVGLIRSREQRFLESTLRTRHLDWGLRHLAQEIDNRRQYRLARVINLFVPGVVITMGFMTLVVCVAIFAPLVKLLNDLS